MKELKELAFKIFNGLDYKESVQEFLSNEIERFEVDENLTISLLIDDLIEGGTGYKEDFSFEFDYFKQLALREAEHKLNKRFDYREETAFITYFVEAIEEEAKSYKEEFEKEVE